MDAAHPRRTRSPLRQPLGPHDHYRGPDSAPVTLVEYGDFECPHCAEAEGAIREILAARHGLVRIVFRNFPLRQAHPHAEMAAEAAEAANAQGKYWEMHDLLFEHQDALEIDDLISFAKRLNLDIDRFSSDLFQGKFSVRVLDDLRWGIRSGVDATPSFFINGVRHTGTNDAKSLLQAIDAEISAIETGRKTA